jgi:hypothetical protein
MQPIVAAASKVVYNNVVDALKKSSYPNIERILAGVSAKIKFEGGIDGDNEEEGGGNFATVPGKKAAAARAAHQAEPKSRAKSGFFGVHANGNKWRATLSFDNEVHYLGIFPTKEEAALVYDEFAIKHGLDRDLNFATAEARVAAAARAAHQAEPKPRPKSGFYGVYANGNRWQAYLSFDNELHYLGKFPTKEEAALAYDEFVIKHGVDRDCSFSTAEARVAAVAAAAGLSVEDWKQQQQQADSQLTKQRVAIRQLIHQAANDSDVGTLESCVQQLRVTYHKPNSTARCGKFFVGMDKDHQRTIDELQVSSNVNLCQLVYYNDPGMVVAGGKTIKDKRAAMMLQPSPPFVSLAFDYKGQTPADYQKEHPDEGMVYEHPTGRRVWEEFYEWRRNVLETVGAAEQDKWLMNIGTCMMPRDKNDLLSCISYLVSLVVKQNVAAAIARMNSRAVPCGWKFIDMSDMSPCQMSTCLQLLEYQILHINQLLVNITVSKVYNQKEKKNRGQFFQSRRTAMQKLALQFKGV